MPDLSNEESSRYVQRSAEQRQIIAEVAKVRAGRSRAVLLYGDGGTGKTRLVRQLPKIHHDPKVKWLDPVDVDDSQHWLLSNLEGHVANQLDPDHQYFGEFFASLLELPARRLTPTNRQMVLDHLNRIKDVFTQCYKEYIDKTGNSVVMTFDTVEAIRGMYPLRTLTRWMKALPSTLFILAGRSPSGISEGLDPITAALQSPPAAMIVTAIKLGRFGEADSREYLAPIAREAKLSKDMVDKLVYLTQGHPLWLAITVNHLAEMGPPPEAQAPLDEIKLDLPYHAAPTAAGRDRADSFKRHLMAPYQDGAFWQEAIKRLAVVRESVSRPIWQRLMADMPQPENVTDLDQAWKRLGQRDWIRPRANQHYVTLHDAMAEELAQRVIEVHDADQRWRQDLWRNAAGIYADEAAALESRLAQKWPLVEDMLSTLNAAQASGSAPGAVRDYATLIHEVTEQDHWQQELNQLRAAQLFYLLLSDPEKGAKQLVELLSQATKRHDVLFQDLLAFQMQRFLPGGADRSTLGDTVSAAIDGFRAWLEGEGQDSYVDIGLEMASYLLDREQSNAAINVLDQLPVPADPERCYRLRKLQGNACMRIPGRVREGEKRFGEALAVASMLPIPGHYKTIADAHNELGFYYRNIGHWTHADDAYKKARDAISRAPESGSRPVREAKGSILTNWAYVKGIGGKYDDGISLVESAITIRDKLGMHHEKAISYSVKGEVYRYQRQFKEAWQAYDEAEQLFGGASVSWLGVIYQEQAICLFQSIQAGVQLLAPGENVIKHAESLILESVDLCRVFNTRAYPSALNRAGRIFGSRDPDLGLDYLKQGAERAQAISDGWFWMASLIEYAELCYRAWSDGKKPGYRKLIPAIAEKLQAPEVDELEFPELRGRWNVLQGHLAIRDGLVGDKAKLDAALDNYRKGFPLITHGWVGSYGASAIPGEFREFRGLFRQLPALTRQHWLQELEQDWSSDEESSTQLLARLEELR
jgi:tetratricopeptide (TPR) repeat protein